jgi:hypothetical protein
MPLANHFTSAAASPWRNGYRGDWSIWDEVQRTQVSSRRALGSLSEGIERSMEESARGRGMVEGRELPNL